jgi:hypothetical protein
MNESNDNGLCRYNKYVHSYILKVLAPNCLAKLRKYIKSLGFFVINAKLEIGDLQILCVTTVLI